MAHEVIISHSAQDKPVADAVCAGLEGHGIRCWIAPRDITAGMEWAEAIVDAIEQTRIMVVIFSTHSNSSSQVLREIERAVKNGKIIVPLKIEEVELSKSLQYYLSVPHWLDALNPPLAKHVDELVAVVRKLLGGQGEEKTAETEVREGRRAAHPSHRSWLPAMAIAVAIALAGACAWMVFSSLRGRIRKPAFDRLHGVSPSIAEDNKGFPGGRHSVEPSSDTAPPGGRWSPPSPVPESPVVTVEPVKVAPPPPPAAPPAPVLSEPSLPPSPTLPRMLEIALADNVGMRFMLIQSGKFAMGAPRDEEGRDYDEDLHDIEVTRPFYLGAHEVTRAQFAVFVEATGYKTQAERDGWVMAWSDRKDDWTKQKSRLNWQSPGFAQTDLHPVVYVSWNDAKAFCEWLSETKARPFRLPTEAEWEYACRAGTSTPFHTGATISTDQANYDGGDSYGDGPRGICRESTMEVGRFKPNAWGLHDMHGNVCEWCADFCDDYPLYAAKDPQGPLAGSERVARGGGFYDGAEEIRSAFRHAADPDQRFDGTGFRVALSVDQE